MTKLWRSIAFAACIATISSFGMPTAQAKQQCSAAMPSDAHGYWSWRLIDGRKCWYEGKPMLSKSSLEWPAQEEAQLDSNATPKDVLTEKAHDPLDSNASTPIVLKRCGGRELEGISPASRRVAPRFPPVLTSYTRYSTERFDVPQVGSCSRHAARKLGCAGERIRTAHAASGIGRCG